MERHLGSNKGFSLVELMAVVAIIGILAVIAIPQYKNYRYKAFQAEAKNYLAAIHMGERVFYMEHQGYIAQLDVIGFAPHGKTRYNVGFGAYAKSALGYNATFNPSNFNSLSVCGGLYGAGLNTGCNMFVPVPPIDPMVTVVGDTYVATAVAFESSLVADIEYTSPVVVALESILGAPANAVIPPSGPTVEPPAGLTVTSVESSPSSGYDGWVVDQNNRLRRGQISSVHSPIPCGEPGSGCYTQPGGPNLTD